VSSPLAGNRRRSRTIALQILYETDSSKHSTDSVFAHIKDETKVKSQTIRFSKQIIDGVLLNREPIDKVISEFAPLFPLGQMAIIDRNILRIALWEILFDSNDKVPMKVAVNEAVELAKIFGGEASPKFINGVLGAIISAKILSPDTAKIVNIRDKSDNL
jgi:N utilization substance protein B